MHPGTHQLSCDWFRLVNLWNTLIVEVNSVLQLNANRAVKKTSSARKINSSPGYLLATPKVQKYSPLPPEAYLSKARGFQDWLICLSTISDCSGDVRRENRFVRAPPRPSSQPIRRPGDRPHRPAIINADDLKDLDELDHDTEDGWAGQYFLDACEFRSTPSYECCNVQQLLLSIACVHPRLYESYKMIMSEFAMV